jgi:AcrR family transcriptional regulator
LQVTLVEPMGRRRNAEATRDSILQAARCRFVREGYDGAGVREIAADAGVDAALVSRYFGGKEDLFGAVMDMAGTPADLFTGTPEAFARRMARMLVHEPQNDHKMACIVIMLRSASSDRAGECIRRVGRERFYGPMAAWLGGRDPEVLARLLGSVMMGFGVARAINPDFQLDEAELGRLEGYVFAMLQSVLTQAGAQGD